MARVLSIIGSALAACLVGVVLAALVVSAGGQVWLLALGIVLTAVLIRAVITGWDALSRRRVRDERAAPGDPTVEIRVRHGDAPSLRPLTPALHALPSSSRIGAAIASVAVLSLAVLFGLPLKSEDESVHAVPPVLSGAATEEETLGDVLQDEDASAVPVVADPTAQSQPAAVPAVAAPSTRARASHTITPSLARRECLAQVESAHLFMGIARRASSPTAYTRLTNTEIKRLASERPIGPYTLQHIAQRMWDRRAEPERSPAWWTRQYARCAETRTDGGTYVVRG